MREAILFAMLFLGVIIIIVTHEFLHYIALLYYGARPHIVIKMGTFLPLYVGIVLGKPLSNKRQIFIVYLLPQLTTASCIILCFLVSYQRMMILLCLSIVNLIGSMDDFRLLRNISRG